MKFLAEFEERKNLRLAVHYLAFARLHRFSCSEAEAALAARSAGSGAAAPATVGRLQLTAAEASAVSALFSAQLHAELVRVDRFVAAERRSRQSSART